MKNILILLTFIMIIPVLSFSITLEESLLNNGSRSMNNIYLSYRLIADIKVNPYSFDFLQKTHNLGFEGSLMNGLIINKFTLGLLCSAEYQTLNNSAGLTGFKGSNMVIKGLFTVEIPLIKWITITPGLGGHWRRTSFNTYEDLWIGQNKYGVSMILNGTFKIPFKYIEFELRNKLDITDIFNFQKEAYRALLNYQGGIQINFYPVLKWMKLYVDTTFVLSQYQDQFIDTTYYYPSFGAGIIFDIKLSREIKKNKKINKK